MPRAITVTDPTLDPLTVPGTNDPHEASWAVVLERTLRGEDEIRRPLMPLSKAQQELLLNLDGKRSLRLLVVHQPELRSGRLARDAARLLAFGLVRQVSGELPRALVVDAMNQTMRLPAQAVAAMMAAHQQDTNDTPADDRATAPAAAGGLPKLVIATIVLGAALAAWLMR